LGEALRSLKLGIVDAKRLTSTSDPAQFATNLISEHLRKENPDALVVLGRKAGWDTRVSHESQESLEEPGIPAFYLSYNSEQSWTTSWDPISRIMKHLRGFEYYISRPKDFFNAWSDVVSRIVRTKQSARAPSAAIAGTK